MLTSVALVGSEARISETWTVIVEIGMHMTSQRTVCACRLRTETLSAHKFPVPMFNSSQLP